MALKKNQNIEPCQNIPGFYRSNRPDMFCKKDVIRNFAKFTGNHLCQCLYFNMVAGFIKIETLAQVFPCEFCKISKNTFSYRTPPVAAFVLMKKCLLNFAWHHVILKKNENLLKSNKPVSVRIQQIKNTLQ